MPSGRFINLRAKPFNDADLIIDALSVDGERMVLTAKNAMRSKRRFGGGVLEPINFVEFFYTQARSGYHYIQEARIIYPFQGLRQDYKKLECAFHFLRLIGKAAQEGLPDNKMLFDLLGNALKVLESSERIDVLKLQFELKYLFYLGFLGLDNDTHEFVAKPIREHKNINLTDDEYHYLKTFAKNSIRESLSLRPEQEAHF